MGVLADNFLLYDWERALFQVLLIQDYSPLLPFSTSKSI